MKFETSHLILASGPDFASCRRQVFSFFEKTPLVQYDSVRVGREQACSAAESRFWERMALGMGKNRQVLGELLGELKEAGAKSVDDLLELPQGYQSKLVHTVAHLLDGFFGIDTVFYNLVEGSHWVDASLKAEIEAKPADYWLLAVAATLKIKERHAMTSLRTFETGSRS